MFVFVKRYMKNTAPKIVLVGVLSLILSRTPSPFSLIVWTEFLTKYSEFDINIKDWAEGKIVKPSWMFFTLCNHKEMTVEKVRAVSYISEAVPPKTSHMAQAKHICYPPTSGALYIRSRRRKLIKRSNVNWNNIMKLQYLCILLDILLSFSWKIYQVQGEVSCPCQVCGTDQSRRCSDCGLFQPCQSSTIKIAMAMAY